MDPQNGEIFAMALRPTYDRTSTTRTDREPPHHGDNRLVSSRIDVRPITAAAAETGKVSVNDRFFAEEAWVGPDILVHVSEGTESDFSEVIETLQCRFYRDWSADRSGRLLQVFGPFRVTSSTGIDLPGEMSGIIVQQEEANR